MLQAYTLPAANCIPDTRPIEVCGYQPFPVVAYFHRVINSASFKAGAFAPGGSVPDVHVVVNGYNPAGVRTDGNKTRRGN